MQTTQMIDLAIIALSESLSKPGNYALILEDTVGKRRIPLIIGASEAQAIAVSMEKMQPLRPFTHDLFFETLRHLNATMTEARLTRVEQEIFYANVILTTPTGDLLTLDARPSDAIALAVRFNCPLRTTAAVVEASGYYIDEKVRDRKGSYAEYTLTELHELLARIIRKQDYESAARVRDAIDRREQSR